MAASDARGPQFGEGPAIHFRLSRVRSLPGPTATGLYLTVLLCMLFSLHDGSARCFREASDWPLRRAAHPIGRRCSSSLLLFLPWFSPPLSRSPLCSTSVFSFSTIRPATFALALKQATQYACICLSSGWCPYVVRCIRSRWIGSGTRLRVRPTSNSHYGMIRESVLRAAIKPWEACTSG